MPTYTYPHTIDNGAGERLTFLRRVSGPRGDRLEGENVVAPGAGPPMHVHHYQEEALTVREGRIGYQRPGQAPQYAGPGETVVFPIMIAVGTLLGRYARYADAPAPIHR